MKGFSVLFLILALILIVSANECPVKSYTTKLIPECDTGDLRVKWPNYENQSSYYKCQSIKNAVLVSCAKGEVFVYVYQKCKACSDYIPPVDCKFLPTQNTPNFVPIEHNNSPSTPSTTPSTSSNYPTPQNPSSSSPSYTTTTSSPINDGTSPFPESTYIISTGKTMDTGKENSTEYTVTSEISGTTFSPPPHAPSQPSNLDLPTPPSVDPTPPLINATPPEALKA